jgi:hypothetical protein
MADNPAIIWAPQRGPQTILVRCHVAQDILLAGTRGWGKTDGVLGDWLYHLLKYREYAAGLFVRPTYPELEKTMLRAQKLYQDIAEWNEQKKTFRFYGGGIFQFRHLRMLKDAQAHQGDENTWINVEEATNYPTPDVPDLLWGTLRSVHSVTTRYLMTANPGGPGHNWVKSRYIDPAPPFKPFDAVIKFPDGREFRTRRITIAGRLEDNKILLKSDPTYPDRLAKAAIGQEWLLRAWLDGDWNITAGGMFDSLWRQSVHVLKPFKIPDSWRIYRAFDWGSTKPFSIGWWAISNGEEAITRDGRKRHFPPGTFIRAGEWYGWNGTPNRGCGLFDTAVAAGIREREERVGWKVFDGPADSSIFTKVSGKAIADDYKSEKIFWKPADKSPGSRIAGWRKLAELLDNAVKNPLELPGLYVFDNCAHFIRTVPVLPRDPMKPDDVDTNAEDHIGDETRYMITYKPNVGKMTRIPGF